MSYEPDVHQAQSNILRALLFTQHAGFADLQKTTELSSDHFNFHIKKLLAAKLIVKTPNGYSLTSRGKEYSNRMDTDENEIEKQPKISVALLVERTHDGRREFIVQQRLKQPYFGFFGRLGGKIRWGESFEEAASRELTEETGLTGSFTFSHIFHKRDYRKSDGSLLEDKVFVVMHCKNATGKMNSDFEGGKNFWMTQEEFIAQHPIFESARDFIVYHDKKIPYHSQTYIYDENQY